MVHFLFHQCFVRNGLGMVARRYALLMFKIVTCEVWFSSCILASNKMKCVYHIVYLKYENMCLQVRKGMKFWFKEELLMTWQSIWLNNMEFQRDTLKFLTKLRDELHKVVVCNTLLIVLHLDVGSCMNFCTFRTLILLGWGEYRRREVKMEWTQVLSIWKICRL